MKACLTALYFYVASFLFHTSAAELSDAERKIFQETKAKAERGEAKEQYLVGSMYFRGEGVAKDEAEAVSWYRKAAEQNHAIAQGMLGSMYEFGAGVTKDYAEAMKWYRKAAEQGFSTAQFNLGVCYYHGQGVVKDEVEAYKWWLLAGAQGDEVAKKNYGLLENRLTATQRAEGQKLAREFKPRLMPSTGANGPEASGAQARPESTGTGFFITDDGYFITNQHVAGEGATVRLVTAAGSVAAKVVKVDKANDLALLKAEGKFTALPVITSRGVRLGATAATVGFPNTGLQGFAPKLAKGEIASLAGAQDDVRHFQISAPIQPGNSGGALVDERGNVIGVVVAKLSQRAALATSGALAENVNYAVKSSYLLSFLESVPEVAAKLKDAHTKDRKFEDVVKSVEQATVLVLVY
jgi:TPR repeat protein